MSEKLKVIICTDGIFPHAVGGMQRHSRLLIEELAKGEVEVIVIHPHSGTNVFEGFENIREITIENIDTNKNYLSECYKYSKRVYFEILKYPDAIIYSQGLSVWHGVKNLTDRLIVNPHGLEGYQTVTFREKMVCLPFRMIFNYLFRNSSYVVSLGGKLTDILKKSLPGNTSKILVLPNAVNIPKVFDKPAKINNQTLNLFFIARFAANKGIHILLQAVRELNEEGYIDKITYNLGGKGPLFEEYSTKYKFKNVNYLGFVSDEQLSELYRNNDLFVFPTLFEGMPTVVLEAMSYSLPVIVSDTGATCELVGPENGYLIEKNNVSALKQAIKDFYNLPTGAKNQLSANSLEKVKQHFTWKVVAERHLEFLKALKLQHGTDKKI